MTILLIMLTSLGLYFAYNKGYKKGYDVCSVEAQEFWTEETMIALRNYPVQQQVVLHHMLRLCVGEMKQRGLDV